MLGPIDHGMCHSIYFGGPENLSLEVAHSAVPIDERAWIDPEVVAVCGIKESELAAMKSPAAFVSRNGAIPQPPLDLEKPHMHLAQDSMLLHAMVAMTDEEVWEKVSWPEPPVKVED